MPPIRQGGPRRSHKKQSTLVSGQLVKNNSWVRSTLGSREFDVQTQLLCKLANLYRRHAPGFSYWKSGAPYRSCILLGLTPKKESVEGVCGQLASREGSDLHFLALVMRRARGPCATCSCMSPQSSRERRPHGFHCLWLSLFSYNW